MTCTEKMTRAFSHLSTQRSNETHLHSDYRLRFSPCLAVKASLLLLLVLRKSIHSGVLCCSSALERKTWKAFLSWYAQHCHLDAVCTCRPTPSSVCPCVVWCPARVLFLDRSVRRTHSCCRITAFSSVVILIALLLFPHVLRCAVRQPDILSKRSESKTLCTRWTVSNSRIPPTRNAHLPLQEKE
jgi:hypothetical protein